MWEIIEKNKKKCSLLSFLMLCSFLMTGMFYGFLVGSLLAFSASSITLKELFIIYAFFGAIGIVIVFIVYLIKNIGLERRIVEGNFNNCIFAIGKDARKIVENVVQEMSIAAGLMNPPEVYVVHSETPNAFAVGLNPEKSKVVLTTALLATLNRAELQAVVAHEIAHIKNLDCKVMTKCYMMLYFMSLMFFNNAQFFSDSPKHSRIRFSSSSSSKNSSKGNIVELIIVLMIVISIIYIYFVAPFLSKFLYEKISQSKEYLADACAVQFSRYPEGLKTALEKISGCKTPCKDKKLQDFNGLAIIPNLTSEIKTHPDVRKRIKILAKLGGCSLNDYVNSYKTICDGKLLEKLDKTQHLDIVAPTAKDLLSILQLNNSNQTTNSELDVHRIVGNIEEKIAGYDTIECPCQTKLKIPDIYFDIAIVCPHCKKVYKKVMNEWLATKEAASEMS